MDRGNPRRGAGFNSRQLRRPDRIGPRPDRIAFWALIMALIAMLAAAVSADAAGGTGGVGSGGNGSGGVGSNGCASQRFGERQLSEGDCGSDVKVLNWILNSKEFGMAAGLGQTFDGSTEEAVSSLQDVAGLPTSGVVDDETRGALVTSMRRDEATWYGPTLYGNSTACGLRLTRATMGVAHKTLPCGTKVVLRYQGRYLRTTVIDRGPYVDGVKWDMTKPASDKLGLTETGRDFIRSAIVRP